MKGGGVFVVGSYELYFLLILLKKYESYYIFFFKSPPMTVWSSRCLATALQHFLVFLFSICSSGTTVATAVIV